MVQNPTDKFVQMRHQPPEDAKFFWNGGPIEVADRTWFASLLSGVTAFETDDGLVLVDTGTKNFGPHLAREIREATDSPVHTAIYTHGHVDHAFGLAPFLIEGQSEPTVIGHRAMPARFERYERTSRHNRSLNARQFGGAVDATETVDFEAPAIPPNLLYDDELRIEVGGVTFELFHARGETDDHTWVYCPDRGVLCPGDLVIWGVPNAGNPQKVQRYPWDWAKALRAMAAKQPRSLAPGHGGPVVDDAALVERILLETAELLEAIVARTLEVLEDGSPPHVDVVRRVDIPVSESPWLQPVYDEGEFIVRNVIRYYGGWFSGRPSELKPADRDEVATAMAAVAGGSNALLDEATRRADGGDLRVACHLADYALEAAPDDAAIQAGVAEIYERRASEETSLMAINLYRSAAAYARAGRPYR
ncbi:MAG: alkyl sulfatase dimerization domain-containing protein [Acidimicrobiia bacterium]